VYATSGTFNISVTVSDGAASAVATARVFVPNTTPVANAGGRYENSKNQPTSFNGSFSVDGDGDPLTYRWNFGDGSTGSGAQPAHTYARGGVYAATLIVNDGQVDSAPSAAQVTVINHAPVANGGGPYTGIKSQPVAFNGGGSSDADNDTLSYLWDFGDGTTGSGVAPTHAYTKSGRFTLKLTVNDGEVNSATYQTTVDVKNR
jgi:PKD repeat protein